MILSNEINYYNGAMMPDPTFSTIHGVNPAEPADPTVPTAPGAPRRNDPTVPRQPDMPDTLPGPTSTLKITPEGDRVMQYTTIVPGGAIFRKDVLLTKASDDEAAFGYDYYTQPVPMLRARAEAFESMMTMY